MKTKLFVILFIAAILIGCNPIPNKSIFEELSTKELAKAIDKEPKFESCYKMVQETIWLLSTRHMRDVLNIQ